MKKLVNDDDTNVSKVKLIDNDGNVLYDTISKKQALDIAREKKLDLVKMGDGKKDDVTICKLMNYGKYKYKKSKQDKKQRQKQIKNQKIKRIMFKIITAEHDIAVKANNAKKILSKGIRVIYGFELRNKEKKIASIEEIKKKLEDILKKYDFKEVSSWKKIDVIENKYNLMVVVELNSKFN